jgi:hypothetical protein
MSKTEKQDEKTPAILNFNPADLNEYALGTHWVWFIPPGWLLGGTIVSASDKVVVLKDACYLESVSQGKSNIGDVAMAKSQAEQMAACTSSYQLPDGFRVRVDAMFLAAPANVSLRGLATRNSMAALKGSR